MAVASLKARIAALEARLGAVPDAVGAKPKAVRSEATPPPSLVVSAKAGTQHAAAYRFNR
jgi:hypothetical protein